MSDKKLMRSDSNKMLFGVAAGLAEYLNIDPTLMRLLFVVLTLAGGPGLIAYIVLAIVLPREEYIGRVDGFHEDEVVIGRKEPPL
jgi:phage shock protein C